jgi:hypothetical protein
MRADWQGIAPPSGVLSYWRPIGSTSAPRAIRSSPTSTGGDVERALARGAFDVWWRAQIEQQLDRLAPVVSRRGEERFVGLQELRVPADLGANRGLVVEQAGGDEPLYRIQRHRGAPGP